MTKPDTLTLTFRDLKTGQTVTHVEDTLTSPWWWTDGNGSDDCNRTQYFEGVDEEIEAEQRAAHPEWFTDNRPGGMCFGAKRIVIIAVDPMPEGCTLADFNQGYPPDSWLPAPIVAAQEPTS